MVALKENEVKIGMRYGKLLTDARF